jgi:cytoskeletal protein RodZ
MARVRMIRHRVVVGAVALFVAVWLLIAITLISGHDPALARKSASTTASATSANTSGSTAATSTSSDTGSGTTAGTGTTATSTPGSVTTRQS